MRLAVRALGWQRRSVRNAEEALREVQRDIADRTELAGTGVRRLEPLSTTEAVDLLQRQSFGRLVYIARKEIPDVVPVNYTWDGDSVLIRSGPGPKLQAAQRHEVVAFEVDDFDVESRTGTSVVVIGRAEVIPAQRSGAEMVDLWVSGPRRHVIRVVPTRIAGRRLA